MSPPTRRPTVSDDRDQLVPKHPAVPEIFDDEGTSPHGTPIEKIEERSRRSLKQTIHAREDVATLRVEMREEIVEVQGGLVKVNDRLDVMGEHVGDLRAVVGKMDGTLGVLVDSVKAQTNAALHHQTVTMTAKVEVDKAQQIDGIEQRKWRRDLILKVLGLATPIIAALATAITLLAQHC